MLFIHKLKFNKMEKNSIVKQAKYLNKTWANDYGTFHVHGIAFENGDFGEYSSKDAMQEKFIVGQPATYELSGSPGRMKVKPVAPDQKSFVSGGPSVPTEYAKRESQADKNRGFALSYAKDIMVGRMEREEGYKFDEMELLQLAETFASWLSGTKKEPTIISPDLPPTTTPSDDLPF